ncbi:tuftelin 1a isoform X2 [Neoarius graeffei]|uniref:tuftelin 1a isoform X2 n=1 Tax=Neoarius graeffei TaxID=443677 RepID=UPI00298C23B1|nr:tuftelin 1a isoform X2 [Neoarius graeffei]
MSSTRSMCLLSEVRAGDRADGCRRLRLTLHDQVQQQPTVGKPIGRAFALVQPTSERQPLKNEPSKVEENVEVIKVYLQAQKKEQDRNQRSLKMLSDEVSQIQEVRYCLKSLREQMAAKNNHRTEHKVQLVQIGMNRENCALASRSTQDSEEKQPLYPSTGSQASRSLSQLTTGERRGTPWTSHQEFADEQERERMREVSKRLYPQLQEAEKRHQEEKEKLQAEAGQYKRQLSEQSDELKEAQRNAQQQDQRIRELQRLMGGMEQESSSLRDELMTREAELLRLRELKEEGQADRERLEALERENAVLKEKIYHLDDMLKSQQRKLRQMIEQLQNSRMVIQERDRVIKELEEKVAFLEAENRELRDQVDYFLNGQRSNSGLLSDSSPQIVYSKPLKPSTQSNKNLPFIKVIEIKS